MKELNNIVKRFVNNNGKRRYNLYLKGKKDFVHFFEFGCWNKHIDKTNRIIAETNNIDYDFGVINGDNVYQQINDEGKKVYNLKQIDDGFNILKKSIHPLYLSVGNHEVHQFDDCRLLIPQLKHATLSKNMNMNENWYSINIFLSKKYKTFKTSSSLSKSSDISPLKYSLKLKQKYIRSYSSKNSSSPIRTNNQKDYCKICIIDTNLFDNTSYNSCYGDYANRYELLDKMLQWLKNEMEEYKKSGSNDPLIIMGHYPPYFFKSSRKVHGCLFMENMKKLTDMIFNYKNKVIYFSADAHNYQHLEIKNLEIIIAGTGGDSLDSFSFMPDLDAESHKVYEADSGKLTEDSIKINDISSNYGWIDCVVNLNP